jgi:hypothetical protein
VVAGGAPLELGGLGILDLTTLGYALRMHWLWLARTDPDWCWSVLPQKDERLLPAMFDVSTIVIVGDSRSAMFWLDRWLDGRSLQNSCNKVGQRSSPERLLDQRHQWCAGHGVVGAVRAALGAGARVSSPEWSGGPLHLEMVCQPTVLVEVGVSGGFFNGQCGGAGGQHSVQNKGTAEQQILCMTHAPR